MSEAFDPAICAQYVETLILSDEVERALLVLDNVPAYFRDHPPPLLAKLKTDILSKMFTPHAYVHCLSDAVIQVERSAEMLQYLARGKAIIAEVDAFNEQKLVPHIVEAGPGVYFIPLGLEQLGKRFTYEDIALNNAARLAAGSVRKERESQDQPVLFVAQEIIEHLPEPRDLVTDCLRHCGRWPDRVFLSTPLYTFDSRSHVHWRTNVEGLPHLRAYTPSEFYLTAMRLFPGYDWVLDASQVMSLCGRKKLG